MIMRTSRRQERQDIIIMTLSQFLPLLMTAEMRLLPEYGKIYIRIKNKAGSKAMEMKRVLLKLSGEALAGPKKTGFDEATVIWQ